MLKIALSGKYLTDTNSFNSHNNLVGRYYYFHFKMRKLKYGG